MYWYNCQNCLQLSEITEEQVGGAKPIVCPHCGATAQGVVFPCWRSDGELAIKGAAYLDLIAKADPPTNDAISKSASTLYAVPPAGESVSALAPPAKAA